MLKFQQKNQKGVKKKCMFLPYIKKIICSNFKDFREKGVKKKCI